ncbi:MAG: putative porin [Saprospiraceae bacterium]|nr:putative porin [Saprospiraceae bacterium]
MNMYSYPIIFSCLITVLCTINIVQAQQNAQTTGDTSDVDLYKPLGDTNDVYYYYLEDPELLISIDTTLDDLEYVNPAWKDFGNWDDLGLIGTPHFSKIYETSVKAGFRVGMEQYDQYRLDKNNQKYYIVDRNLPYTDLYYSQIEQRNSFVRATFAHRITPQFYYTINYNLTNYTGYFNHSHIRNQNINLSLRYNSPKGKYQSYFDVFHHAIKHENNGGVVDDATVSGTGTAFLTNLSVNTATAQTENKHTTIAYTQYWYNVALDSNDVVKKASSAWGHRIQFQSNRYKFYDTNPAGDSSYYASFQTNNRGIRHFINHSLLENELSYRQALGGNLQAAPLWFKIYIQHRWNFVNQEPLKFQQHNLVAGLVLRSNPKLALFYKAEGEVLNASNGLDFWLKGKLGYDLKKWGKLSAEVLFERFSPSLLAQRLYVSRTLVWENVFAQEQILSLGGKLDFPKLKFLEGEAFLQNHTLNNFIYYDTLGQAQQANNTINVLQLGGKLKLKLWKFTLENKVVWQRVLAGTSQLRLPELLLQHKLYFQDRVFKNMLLRFGVNMRYNTNYYANGYLPLTGQFHLQDARLLTYYPIVDFYISFKVWRFRFFANAENLTNLINQTNYFKALHYAAPNFLVRFGVSWRLFD